MTDPTTPASASLGARIRGAFARMTSRSRDPQLHRHNVVRPGDLKARDVMTWRATPAQIAEYHEREYQARVEAAAAEAGLTVDEYQAEVGRRATRAVDELSQAITKRLAEARDAELLAKVRDVLAEAGIPPERVDLSTLDDGRVSVVIDETELAEDPRQAELASLADLGVTEIPSYEQYVNERAYAEAAGITVEEYRAAVDDELAEVENPEAAFERAMDEYAAQADRERMQADHWARDDEARRQDVEDAQVDANRDYAEVEVERVSAQLERAVEYGYDLDAKWSAAEELTAKVARLRQAEDAYDAHHSLGAEETDAEIAARREEVQADIEAYQARVIPEYGVAYEDLDQYQLADYHEAQDAERERVVDVDAAHAEALVWDAGRDVDALEEQLRYMPWPSADKAALRADLAAARARYDELVDEDATARAEAAQERAIEDGERAVEEVQVAEALDPTNPSNALTHSDHIYADPAVRAAIRAEIARTAVDLDQEEANLAREYVDVHGHTPESAKANAAIERAEAEAVDLEELEAESREAAALEDQARHERELDLGGLARRPKDRTTERVDDDGDVLTL